MRILLFSILAILNIAGVSGQMIVKSQSQTLIEDAIGNGLYVFVQSYQLEDTVTHKRFGRFGNDYFGSKAALAIRTTDGDIVASDVMSPWKDDANFDKYKQTHKPVLSTSKMIEFGDSAKTAMSVKIDSLQRDVEFSRIFMTDSISRGFQCRGFDGTTEGWAVWVANDSVIDNYAGSDMPEFTIHKQTLDFKSGSSGHKISAPNISKQVWGGIFIVPRQTAIGQITFLLAGVITKDAEAKEWIIIPPVYERPKAIEDSQAELTPLEKSSDKKQKNKRRK